MANLLNRLWKVLGLMFKPIPEVSSIWQTAFLLICVFAPILVGTVSALAEWIGVTITGSVIWSALLFGVLALVAAYRLQKQIDGLRDGNPNLICKGFGQHDATIHDGIGNTFGTPTYYHIKIVNEPRGIVDRKVAEKVVGNVAILSQDGKEVCASKLHRWAHSLGPLDVGKRADISQPQDISPEVEYLLDIAMKYDAEEEFYTPTNDTATRGNQYPGMRDTRYRFPPGEYIARIRLGGANVVKYLECKIINRGSGKKLELQHVSTPLSKKL